MSDDPFQIQDAGGPESAGPASIDSGGGLSGARMLSSGNVILLVIAVTGVGAVLFLRSRGGVPAEASADQQLVEQQVDTALLQAKALAGNRRARKAVGQSILERFYYQAEARQVPPEQLRGDPFRFRTPPGKGAEPQPETPKTEPVKNGHDDRRRLRQALQAVADLKLQSVLSGASGRVAMVSNNMLTAGQTIRGWRVVEVGPRSVTLQWRDHSYILRMRE